MSDSERVEAVFVAGDQFPFDAAADYWYERGRRDALREAADVADRADGLAWEPVAVWLRDRAEQVNP